MYKSISIFRRFLRRGISLDARSLPTHYNTTHRNRTRARTHISMPRARFELTISVFERSKTVHALDSAAIGTGY